jgi:hypothetical protein
MEKEIDVQEVLKHMREIIGMQAQDIAILKARIESLTNS